MLLDKPPSWGLTDIALVYLGVMFAGMSGSIWRIPLLSMLNVADTLQNRFYYGFGVQFFTTVVLVLLLAIVYHKASWNDLGFNKSSTSHYWRYGVIGGLVLVGAVLCISLPISIINPELPPQSYEEILRQTDSGLGYGYMLAIGVIFGPFSEELFFRGMIYPVMRKYLGVAGGIAAAGFLFALAHWDLWRIIPLMAGGMGLCYIYEKTGSIWVSTLAHSLWNGTMALLIYLSYLSLV